ncbi:MAG TPA: hypothetical protein VNB90_04635 [Cytophagaceae bacterium]|nr:hypothetical protein [Cytophagaceae bacterium]
MKAVKIKTELHQSIENIEDIDFLKAIQTIVQSRNTQTTEEPILTKKQIAGLKQSLKKIKSGRVISNKAVQNFFDECLKK